jgi:hypothetical protein
MATAGFRVTYATLSADDEELHAGFGRGLEEPRSRLGRRHGSVVAGSERPGEGSYERVLPGDATLAIGSFAVASRAFGGWNASGTSGKAGGGAHYLQQYMREQSRTIVTERLA